MSANALHAGAHVTVAVASCTVGQVVPLHEILIP